MNQDAIEELQKLFDKVTLDLMRKIQELKDENRELREQLHLPARPNRSPQTSHLTVAVPGQDLKETIRYRLGDALISVTIRPKKMVALPVQLGRLLKEGYIKYRSRMNKLRKV